MRRAYSYVASRFLYLTSFVMAGAVVGAAGHYLFQLAMSRLLGVEAFGALSALLAIYTLLALPASAIEVSVARFVSELRGQAAPKGEATRLIRQGFLGASILGLGVAVVLVMASSMLAGFLKLESPGLIFLVAVSVLLAFVMEAAWGALQGLQKFAHLVLSFLTYPFVRLTTGISLVGLGLGVSSGLIATSLGPLSALLVGFMALRPWSTERESAQEAKPRQGSSLRALYSHWGYAMVASLCLAVPTALDVMVARHFFSSQVAGLYAVTALLGKIVIFIPLAISQVMLPKVAESYFRGGATFGLIARSLALDLMTALCVAATFWLIPAMVIGTLFGPSYLGAAPVVQWYGLALVPFTLIFVVTRYSLAIDNFRYIFALLGYTVLEAAGMLIFHQSPLHIVATIGVSSSLFLGYSLFQVLRTGKARHGLAEAAVR